MMRNRGTALPSHATGYDTGGGGYDGGGNGYGGFNGNGNGGGGGSGYGGDVYGSSPSSSNATFKDKARPRGGAGSEPWKNPLVLYGVAAFFILTTLYYRSSGNGILKALNVNTRDAAIELVQGLEKDVSKWKLQGDKQRNDVQRKSTQEINRLEKENRNLQKERDTLRVKHEGPEKVAEDARLVKREDAWKQQLSLLQTATKRESRRSVLERYVLDV